MPDDFYLRITKEMRRRLEHLLDECYSEWKTAKEEHLLKQNVACVRYNAVTDVIEEIGLRWSRDKDGNHRIE